MLVAASLAAAPAASAAPGLQWQDRSQVPDVVVQCANQAVPLDYDTPGGKTIQVAVARVPAKDQAHRIGSLFFNLGGPGGTQVDFLETGGSALFDASTAAMTSSASTRGVGQSSPSIDCKVNQETEGPNSQPFPTAFTLNLRGLLTKDQRYLRR